MVAGGWWGWLMLLPLFFLPSVVPQGFNDEVWGEWDSVTCYACGLAAIDPESDQEGTYGVDPGEGKKMYNHSCDLMDNAVRDPTGPFTGQILKPRNHVKKVAWALPGKPILVNGSRGARCEGEAAPCAEGVPGQLCFNRTTVIDHPDGLTEINDKNETVPVKVNKTECVLQWETGYDTVPLPPKTYDMSMWLRRCPKGVRSCFRAQGNWDSQRPVFRGCAGAQYAHGTTCRRELQRVQTEPGRPKVDVEVYLCYCTGDECNMKTIAGGATGTHVRPGGLVSSIINYTLLAALLLIILD